MAQRRMAAFRAIATTMLLLSLGLLFWLDLHYQKIRPTTPNEQGGAVYPLDDHGRVVYLTLGEHRRFVAVEACFIALWLCGGAIEIWRRWVRRREGPNARAHPV